MYVTEHILVLIFTTKKYGVITKKLQPTEVRAKSSLVITGLLKLISEFFSIHFGIFLMMSIHVAL